MSKPFRESLEEQLKNPEFKKEWDALEPEFKEIKEHLNKETIAAMSEAERISHDPGVKHYSDVEEALKELKT